MTILKKYILNNNKIKIIRKGLIMIDFKIYVFLFLIKINKY